MYRVRVDKRDDWLTRALQDPTDPTKPRKVKYCRIVREMRKGKERFFLQLVAEGSSPLKHAYAGKDLRMAIDPGLGSLTYATEDGTIAKVQIAPSADTDHRAVRKLRRIVREMRKGKERYFLQSAAYDWVKMTTIAGSTAMRRLV